MIVPAEADWSIDHSNPRQNGAYKHFFGKSLEEAESMISLNPVLFHEDFWWMPEIPFKFYLKAYVNYLRSTSSQSDVDTAKAFLILVARLIRSNPGLLAALWEQIEATLDYIAANQSWFDADPECDGNFTDIVQNLKNSCQTQNSLLQA